MTDGRSGAMVPAKGEVSFVAAVLVGSAIIVVVGLIGILIS